MANQICGTCLRELRRRSAVHVQQTPKAFRAQTSRRLFATSTSNRAQLPPSASPASSIPPVDPIRAEGFIGKNAKTKPAKSSAVKEVKEGLQKAAKKAAQTYTAYGVTEFLYKECASHADYTVPQASSQDEEVPTTADGEELGVGTGWWLEDTGLKPTFATWSQVTMLHMYLLTVRFRCLSPSTSQTFQQHLLDHFFYDAENRMVTHHNIQARGARNKYLKDLNEQWRGLLAAYDEGIVKSDAVLASAVWRNVFRASENVDMRVLASVVSYIRSGLRALSVASDEDITFGWVEFGNPKTETAVVAIKSRLMDMPFDTQKTAPSAK